MAKKPKIQRMKTASRVFIVAFIGLMAAGIAYLYHHDILTGTELVGSAFIPLAIAFGFTLHTTCGVTTTRGTPCKKDSYGFLFGCTGNGHWLEKFSIRLGFRKNEPQQVQQTQRRQPDNVQVLMYQPTSQTQPLRVTVETSARDTWGFWVGVVSMIATVITVVSIFAH
jgi:hypothetical protein